MILYFLLNDGGIFSTIYCRVRCVDFLESCTIIAVKYKALLKSKGL